MNTPIIETVGAASPPIVSACERLEDACHRAGAVLEGWTLTLIDVTTMPPDAAAQWAQHGLDGPQAYRIVLGGRCATLLGHGPLGVAYAVEVFRRDVLGIDPLAFWTGLPIRPVSHLPAAYDRTVRAPCFEHRILFENDADELINAFGRRLQLEWPVWREVIDTAVALGYSGIMPLDSLGRSEFLEWDYYRTGARFELDEALIERVFDYAHDKGLLIAIHMSPSWPFRRLPSDRACWSRYGEEWKAIWRHYLTATPLRKADLFDVGITDPLWDGDVRCRCEGCLQRGIPQVWDDISRALIEVIGECVPGRIVFRCLYNVEGGRVAMPDSGVVAEYSDYGCAEFRELPAVPPGTPAAVYLHAGYWLDHVILNPYLEEIGRAVRLMRDRRATRWVRVNSQSFKPFLLTIEALAAAAWDPDAYDASAFAKTWTARRLGAAAGQAFVDFAEALRLAHEATRTDGLARGYVKLLLGHIYPLFNELAGRQASEPVYFDPRFERDTTAILSSFPDLGSGATHAAGVKAATRRVVASAQAFGAFAADDAQVAFVEDLAVFPARLFDAAADLYVALAALRDAAPAERLGLLPAVREATRALWDLHLAGPAHPKWGAWYLPDRVRIFGTPPRPEMVLWVSRHMAAQMAVGEPGEAAGLSGIRKAL